MTAYPEIFAALAAPFDPKEIKYLPKGGRQLPYITARSVMNRLDAVLGPENWEDRYMESYKDGAGVMCTLKIQIPSKVKDHFTETIEKVGAGGFAGMADLGDNYKSGFSDAFKLAAVKFGIGRYLYEDGVVDFAAEGGPSVDLEKVPTRNTPSAPSRATEAPRGLPEPSSGGFDNFRKPTFGKAMFPWVKNLEKHYQVELLRLITNKEKDETGREKGWAYQVGAGWKMADWTEDQVSDVADKVIEYLKTVPTYKGEFDHQASPKEASSDPQGQIFLRTAKDKLVNKLTELFVNQNPGQRPDPEQLRELLAAISPLTSNFQGSTGEVATSLRSMTDLVWVQNIIKLIDQKLVELNTEDDCPF